MKTLTLKRGDTWDPTILLFSDKAKTIPFDATGYTLECTIKEELQGEKGWAYTTVKTMMDRMVKKGLLKTQRIRNLYLYSSAITQSQARRGEIMRTVTRAFDGTLTPMMQFLIENDELSEQEYSQLEDLIKNRKCRKSASSKNP